MVQANDVYYPLEWLAYTESKSCKCQASYDRPLLNTLEVRAWFFFIDIPLKNYKNNIFFPLQGKMQFILPQWYTQLLEIDQLITKIIQNKSTVTQGGYLSLVKQIVKKSIWYLRLVMNVHIMMLLLKNYQQKVTFFDINCRILTD